MMNLSEDSSKTSRPPYGRITTYPEARIGLYEIVELATQYDSNKSTQDELQISEIFATIADLATDILEVTKHNSMARLNGFAQKEKTCQ